MIAKLSITHLWSNQRSLHALIAAALQRAGDQRTEACTGVLPHVPRAHPHTATCPGAGQRHAGVHAARVCSYIMRAIKLTPNTVVCAPSASRCLSSECKAASQHCSKSTRACVSYRDLMHVIDLSHFQGSFFAWKAASIGKNMINAKTFLEKRFVNHVDLT